VNISQQHVHDTTYIVKVIHPLVIAVVVSSVHLGQLKWRRRRLRGDRLPPLHDTDMSVREMRDA